MIPVKSNAPPKVAAKPSSDKFASKKPAAEESKVKVIEDDEKNKENKEDENDDKEESKVKASESKTNKATIPAGSTGIMGKRKPMAGLGGGLNNLKRKKI